MDCFKERTKRMIIRKLESDEIEFYNGKYVNTETKKPVYVQYKYGFDG